MQRKPLIFLVYDKGLDLHGAYVYGDICHLYQTPPKNIFSTSQKAFELREKLNIAEQGDYLIVAGNMVLVLLAFGILYEKFGVVNLLLYDVRTSEYIARAVPRHQMKGVNDG